MKFLSKYTIRPEHRNEAIGRFIENQAQPPEGVKMLGRWHDIGSRCGYSLVEADDAVAMGKWSQQWTDLLTIESHVVLDDAEFATVISSS